MALTAKKLDQVRPSVPVEEVRKIKRAGKKAIITLSIDPAILAEIDRWAQERGSSRAAAISFAVRQLLGLPVFSKTD